MCPITSNKALIQEAISYTLPQLYTGKEWYIGFYAFDPEQGKLRRKKIKLNFIKSIKERRERAKDIILKISLLLRDGWNPWIEIIEGKSMMKFQDACDTFKKHQNKLYSDGCLEVDSFKTFMSNLSVVTKYNSSREKPIIYVYQFNKDFINEFLDYIYLEKEVSPRTRDNHLAFCRKLASFFCEKGYLNNRPDDGIKAFGKKARKKKRTILESADMIRLVDHLEASNKHYLLACYLLYYCCIRPKELSYLKLKFINLKGQTIFIPSDIAKNDKDAAVTLPEIVIKLMVDLNIFDYPDHYYLFSTGYMPGEKHVNSRVYREYWQEKIRPALEFPDNYVFYSLKDTGITNMLRNHIDPLTVRDQARHSSIEMTNTYASESSFLAQEPLKKYSVV